jgi:hypothetical protein
MVLLATFSIGVAIHSVIKHRTALSGNEMCEKAPMADSVGTPCSDADYSRLPKVSYCDLMAAPQNYENKLVLLRWNYVPMGIGMLRRDDICIKGAADFRLDIVAGAENSATQGLMRAWNAELLPRGSVFIVVGRFRKTPTQIKDHPNQYRLELLRIENVDLSVVHGPQRIQVTSATL